jgi:hypothetical protein
MTYATLSAPNRFPLIGRKVERYSHPIQMAACGSICQGRRIMVLSDLDFACQCLFPWFLGSCVLFFSVGAWFPTRKKKSERQITYGRSWWLRMAALDLAAILISVPFLYRNDPVFWLAAVGTVAPAILSLFIAGPYEITVDLRRETYRVRMGLPFLYRRWQGPLTDIGCMRVISHRSDSGALVTLWWKNNRRLPFALGYYVSRRRGWQTAEEVAGTVKVPVR